MLLSVLTPRRRGNIAAVVELGPLSLMMGSSNLDSFACGFNQRVYRVDDDVTTLRFASTVQYQFLRLDHELYAVYQNNCTRLDGNKTIHCTVEQCE
ncbi:hypothetical protein SprV_0702269300 [Sparganum proliferum]